MKLCVKRIYCPDCRRLARGREETVDGKTHRILCGRCGRPIWLWDGLTWKYTGRYPNDRTRSKKFQYEVADTILAE
jgi:hypothetical protein